MMTPMPPSSAATYAFFGRGSCPIPFTLAIALDYAAMMNVYRGECGVALAHADEAAAICSKHGFAYYLAMGGDSGGMGLRNGG